jgi:EAL domain-containing protein (putative c-di-GMP-specific phosphodiesterase class I)
MSIMPTDTFDVAIPCAGCRLGEEFPILFTMAFQPIVDITSRSVYAYEALVRGMNGESAYSVLSQITAKNRYGFDQACRIRAIEWAARLRLHDTPARLSINFMPNAVYKPRTCINATLRTAKAVDFPLDRLIFEITESEQVVNHAHLGDIIEQYRDMGFQTAIDDFGAGFSGLNLLAKFQPDVIKLDMELIRGIDADHVRRSIVASMLTICRDLNIVAIAEGIETTAERDALLELGVTLQQGYLFARPGFQTLPVPAFDA